MNTVWEFIWELVRALFALLTTDVTPAKAVTSFTLLNILALYAMGRTLRLRRVLLLWITTSLSIVLWRLCVATSDHETNPMHSNSCDAVQFWIEPRDMNASQHRTALYADPSGP